MKALSFALTSVVLFVFCGSASGILLQDDFQGVTAVTMMGQADTKAYPASPPWTIMFDNAGQTNAQVWNNLNVSSPDEDAGANQYLALNHNQSLDDPVAWGSGYNPADTLNKLVQLDFDFWVEGDSLPQGTHGKRLLFTAFDGIEQWSGQPWHVQLRADGTVWNRGGTSSGADVVNTGLTFTADSWQHATILADMMAGTFDLTVAGNTAVDLPFTNTWDNDVGVLYFQSAGGSSGFTGAIDNVRLRLQVGLPGDFNSDGRVNDADYALWESTFGTTRNGDDFLAWQRSFGTGGGATALASAAPEPASVALVLLASLSSLFRRNLQRLTDGRRPIS